MSNEPITVDATVLRQTLGKLMKEQLPGPAQWVDKLLGQAIESIVSGGTVPEADRKIYRRGNFITLNDGTLTRNFSDYRDAEWAEEMMRMLYEDGIEQGRALQQAEIQKALGFRPA